MKRGDDLVVRFPHPSGGRGKKRLVGVVQLISRGSAQLAGPTGLPIWQGVFRDDTIALVVRTVRCRVVA